MEKFKIIEKIGNGFFSEVFLIENKISKNKYAVKFCNKQSPYFEYTWDEIEFLQNVRHENIIKMNEYFEDEKYVYIVLEYFESITLDTFINKNISCNVSSCAKSKIIAQIINTIQYIHTNQYIHGDLNLNNILINDQNQIKIIDFGLSKKYSDNRTKIIGEFIFCSPETIKYKEISYASDLWSLGIVLFKLLTGKFPFEGNNIKSLSLRILNKEINYKNINEKSLLKKLLKKDPKKRFLN